MLAVVEQGPRLSWARVDVAVDAGRAYELLCDVRRVPEWVSGIMDVLPVTEEAGGRVVVADFVGTVNRGSFVYRLRYEYDDGARTVRWSIENPLLRDLMGEARVHELGGGRCRLEYGLLSSTAEVMAGSAHVVLKDEDPLPVAKAFAKWAESQ